MRIGYKFVAASLVMMALLALSAPLALCVADSAGPRAAIQCPPDCPMMAAMQHADATTAMQAASQPSSCCEMSSGRPTPTSELQVPASTYSVAPPALDVTAVALPAAINHVTEISSPPPVSFSQAALCVFLI